MSISSQREVAKNATTAPRGVWLLSPTQALPALLAGLALRVFLVLRFPTDSPDAQIYQELARNWLTLHVYGLTGASGVVPTDIRVPGYPAFLAFLCLSVRCGTGATLLAQSVLDLGTCLLAAWLAATLVSGPQRRRVALAALWLGVMCPFVANYAAVPLTEVLATFLTAAALVAFTSAFINGCVGMGDPKLGDRKWQDHETTAGRAAWMPPWMPWFLGSVLVGFGTLVRPETPLILAALALVLLVRWRRRADWTKLARVGVITALGFLLPLAPWAARNWIRFNEVQLLAPRFANSPGEFVPRGLYAWTATWLVRFRDVYLVSWRVDGEPVYLSDIPSAAFDSADERARVAALLDRYNQALEMSPEVDREFAQLAHERTARSPLRTYLWVPAQRVATLWLTPRVDLLPFSGRLLPIQKNWHENRLDFIVTGVLGAFNFLYIGLAIAGLGRVLKRAALLPDARAGLAVLVVFILLRTVFLARIETPEPRYVLECFPVLFAMGAFCWLKKSSNVDQRAQGES